jgi:hypothetical protein
MKLYTIMLIMGIGLSPATWANQHQMASESNEQVLKQEIEKKDSDHQHHFDRKARIVKKKSPK